MIPFRSLAFRVIINYEQIRFYKTMVQRNQSGHTTKVKLANTNCSISLLIEGHPQKFWELPSFYSLWDNGETENRRVLFIMKIFDIIYLLVVSSKYYIRQSGVCLLLQSFGTSCNIKSILYYFKISGE